MSSSQSVQNPKIGKQIPKVRVANQSKIEQNQHYKQMELSTFYKKLLIRYQLRSVSFHTMEQLRQQFNETQKSHISSSPRQDNGKLMLQSQLLRDGQIKNLLKMHAPLKDEATLINLHLESFPLSFMNLAVKQTYELLQSFSNQVLSYYTFENDCIDLGPYYFDACNESHNIRLLDYEKDQGIENISCCVNYSHSQKKSHSLIIEAKDQLENNKETSLRREEQFRKEHAAKKEFQRCIYIGQFRNGKRNGFGLLLRNDGLLYEGFFQDNFFHKIGLVVYPDGSFYIGEFNNEDEINNRPLKGFSFNLAENIYYRGYYVNHKKHIIGTEINTKMNEVFNGEFFFGKKQGYCKINYRNQDQYQGEFRNFEMTNIGTYSWSDGDFCKGFRSKNMLTNGSPGMFKRGTNYIEFGQWEKNKLSGYGCAKWKKEKIKLFGTFVNGLIHGEGLHIQDTRMTTKRWDKGQALEIISNPVRSAEIFDIIQKQHAKHMKQWIMAQYNQIHIIMAMNAYIVRLQDSVSEKGKMRDIFLDIYYNFVFINECNVKIPNMPDKYEQLFFINLCPSLSEKNFRNILIFDILNGFSEHTMYLKQYLNYNNSIQCLMRFSGLSIEIESDGFFIFQLLQKINRKDSSSNIDMIVIYEEQLKYLRNYMILHSYNRVIKHKGVQVIEQLIIEAQCMQKANPCTVYLVCNNEASCKSVHQNIQDTYASPLVLRELRIVSVERFAGFLFSMQQKHFELE